MRMNICHIKYGKLKYVEFFFLICGIIKKFLNTTRERDASFKADMLVGVLVN